MNYAFSIINSQLVSLFHIIIEPSAPEVFLGLAGRYAAEQDERHEVGDGHEGIHRVGNIPDNIEVDDASEEEGDDIEQAVEAIDVLVLYVVDGALAVVAPAKNRAEGEGQDSEGE